MSKSNRITAAEKANRINKVAGMMLMGASRRNIITYAKENGWQLTDRQIDNYIRDCKDEWQKLYNDDFKKDIAFHIRRNEMLLNKCLNIHDYKGALQVDKNIAELKGLYSQKVELSGGLTNRNFDFSGMTEEELKRELAKMEQIEQTAENG